MSDHPVSCMNDDQLQQLLAAGDKGECVAESKDLDLLAAHLDQCDSCSRRLESLAADDDFWNWSASSLWEDEQQTRDDESAVNFESQLSPVLQTLLGPSEQTESLGRIGRFEILGVVGHGGMGTVLKARDVDIDRVVALKLPAAHLLSSPQALERVEREARSAATIRHPGIIEIYQVERWRGIPYLVMPFHTGPSLMARLRDHGPMQLLEAIRIARQTAEALAAAHRQGVVHRDVKPGNILLGKGTERAVLTDFGIAKLGSDATMTASGVIVGTPAFLSPEQAKGQDVTAQSDLFSLGTVLWTMLVGEPPFVDLPTHTVVASIASGKLPQLKDSKRDLPSWVYRLVARLHQTDPTRRLESAESCAEVLRQCEQHLIQPRHRLPSGLTLVDAGKWRRRVAGVAACLALLWLAAASRGLFPSSVPTSNSTTSNSREDTAAISDSPERSKPKSGLPKRNEAGDPFAAGGMPNESVASGNAKVDFGTPLREGVRMEEESSPTQTSISQVGQTLDDLELELQEVMAELHSMLDETETTRNED